MFDVCVICNNNMTESGEHRICCLPCGHVFGLQCIKRWMQTVREDDVDPNQSCAYCRQPCAVDKIVPIFTSFPGNGTQQPPPLKSFVFGEQPESIAVSDDAAATSSAVMSYTSRTNAMIVSCGLPAQSSYGYRQFTPSAPLPEMLAPSAAPLHTQPISTMSLSPHDTGYVLTGSADGTVVESAIDTAAVTMTIRTRSAVTACAYAAALPSSERRFVYVGDVDGVLRVYDCPSIRRTMNTPSDGNPTAYHREEFGTGGGSVVDLVAISEFGDGTARKTGVNGVLVLRKYSVVLYTNTHRGDIVTHALFSVCQPRAITFEPKSGLIMVTANPIFNSPCAHQVHKLHFVHANVYGSSLVSSFERPAQQHLNIRTSLAWSMDPKMLGGRVFAYIIEESTRKLIAFDAESGRKIAEQTIDMLSNARVHQVLAYADNRCAVLADGRVTLHRLIPETTV